MKNLNPLYEASFMSKTVGKDGKEAVASGWKLFKNGWKKNGFGVFKRNKKAAFKRGQHKIREIERSTESLTNPPTKNVPRASSLANSEHDPTSKKTVIEIGKRARKGQKLKWKHIDDIRRGWSE